MSHTPRKLDAHVNWRSRDVEDAAVWTYALTAADKAELDTALRAALARSDDLLEIGREDFPLPALAGKLAEIERELIDGRGFVRIAGLDRDGYDDDELTLLYWGVGMHLGEPWPQNKHGHVMGDVTDQGKSVTDPTARGNELGLIALDYHTDGSDLVGLMCLRPPARGGLSCVANVVEIHNTLLETRPDLVAALYDELPWDYRGEEPPGGRPFYLRSVFTEHDGRLFCRFIPQYIKASQRHPDAPRLSPLTVEALDAVSAMANDPAFNVYMDLRPGEMQFINNYHVLHGRKAYEDDAATGRKRHLKRLWLATRHLKSRPGGFDARMPEHWLRNRSVSRLHAIA